MNQQQQKKEVRKLPSFYIALCCCVLVIGIAGYFTERHNDQTASVLNTEVTEEKETQAPVFSSETDKQTATALIPYAESSDTTIESDEITQEPESIPVVSEPLPIEDYAVDNPDVEESAVIVSSEQPAFIMPVTGAMLDGYSDKLLYNHALSDWRTHDGIDISAEKGCSVQSVSNGIVDSISETAMGGCVVISHAAGFTSKYVGLESTENLTVGKEIKSGEVIGILGECKGENVTDPHLHFELAKDSKTINPYDYLPH